MATKRKTDDAGGGYYDVRGGLHSAELRMLQRALKEQLQEANRRKAQVKSMGFHLVKEQQEYIDALIRLSNRLRLEISPHRADTCGNPCTFWESVSDARGHGPTHARCAGCKKVRET